MKCYTHPSRPCLFLFLGHDITTFCFYASTVSLSWGGDCLVSVMPCVPQPPLRGVIPGYGDTYSLLC